MRNFRPAHTDKELTLTLKKERAMCLRPTTDGLQTTVPVEVHLIFTDDNGDEWVAERTIKMRLRKSV